MSTGDVPDGAGEVAAQLAHVLPGLRAGAVTPLGSGLDHDAYDVDGTLVVRYGRGPDQEARAAAVLREAALLQRVASVCPVPVPPVRLVVPEQGCLILGRLAGAPLLDRSGAERAAAAAGVGAVLGTVLAALHALPLAGPDAEVDVDDVAPEEWRDEAVETYRTVRNEVPRGFRAGVERFLCEPPAPVPPRRVFSHNDLGVEHVLVEDGRVRGIIDWSDAAITDPAVDLGRILRDLGPAALDSALTAYGADGGGSLRVRAVFYARCTPARRSRLRPAPGP
ncbi:aminoglycoside phosphotransferase family protein [Pseudonocardia sp. RS11V-5]|uniref:aminoglycoside phosphotransferase family protein n=1 Tax=Pseudonocardia terrae TaxID=2905831 RepID=UPI001E358E5B|nr:aminoglycoside phosphotransferase family protein [Pseudonocardia terrae]MCE3554180.1 aminoglycoside phosphotransferase family protein [Pseudonocardia terrae]